MSDTVQAGDIYLNGDDGYIIAYSEWEGYFYLWLHKNEIALSAGKTVFTKTAREAKIGVHDPLVARLDYNFMCELEDVAVQEQGL